MPVKCATLAMAALGASSFAPADRLDTIGSMDDSATGARCHYQTEDMAELCEPLFAALADSMQAQVVDGGWPELYSDAGVGGTDGLDLYVHVDGGGGAYAYAESVDVDTTDGRMGGAAYMVFSPDIASDELDTYMAHEFNHVLQYAMDFTEPTYIPWEGASVVAEELTYPGRGSLQYYVRDFQRMPWASLLHDSWVIWEEQEVWGGYEYGGGLVFEYLRQELAISPSDVWWASVQDGWDNEPDFLDALETVTGDAEASMLGLARVRAQIGQDSAPEWAALFSESSVQMDVELSELGDSGVPPILPYDWGTSFVKVSTTESLTLRFDADAGSRWGVVRVSDGATFNPDQGIPVLGADVFAVVPFGPPGFDGDDRPQQRELEARLDDYEPGDTGDTGDTGTSDDTGAGDDTGGGDDTGTSGDDGRGDGGNRPMGAETGCGCGGGGGVGAFWTLAALGVVRRRR